jgi:hypothetical protein
MLPVNLGMEMRSFRHSAITQLPLLNAKFVQFELFTGRFSCFTVAQVLGDVVTVL